MKKLKHEAELFKAALLAGVRYAEGRNAVEFEASDSASDKGLYVYRLLVHDKIIAPMPGDQVSEKTIRHRLATWYAHQLPVGTRCWDRGIRKPLHARWPGEAGLDERRQAAQNRSVASHYQPSRNRRSRIPGPYLNPRRVQRTSSAANGGRSFS